MPRWWGLLFTLEEKPRNTGTSGSARSPDPPAGGETLNERGGTMSEPLMSVEGRSVLRVVRVVVERVVRG
jgi:hypothetical protein